MSTLTITTPSLVRLWRDTKKFAGKRTSCTPTMTAARVSPRGKKGIYATDRQAHPRLFSTDRDVRILRAHVLHDPFPDPSGWPKPGDKLYDMLGMARFAETEYYPTNRATLTQEETRDDGEEQGAIDSPIQGRRKRRRVEGGDGSGKGGGKGGGGTSATSSARPAFEQVPERLPYDGTDLKDDEEGLSRAEREAKKRERDAHGNAVMLEVLNDLPSADVE